MKATTKSLVSEIKAAGKLASKGLPKGGGVGKSEQVVSGRKKKKKKGRQFLA